MASTSSFGGANGPAANTVSPFPAPPEYAQHYTTENIKHQRILKPPPIPRKFSVFGEEIDMEGKMIQSLPEMGLQQLYSSNANWKSELKKLNKSVVAAFLDLLEILIRCPDNSERREKIETIRMLFINMHHLINEYRPVQARDTLRHMMVKQNKEIKAVTEKLQNCIVHSNQVFNTVISAFKSSAYDAKLPTSPEAYKNPPEFKKLNFKTENIYMTTKEAAKHEFICQNITKQTHLQLLQMADNEEKYSETFSNIELNEISSKSPTEADLIESEENMEFELEEIEEKSSTDHEDKEEESGSNLDVAVEFMDDEEESDGEMLDVFDESDSNPQSEENKAESASSEFVATYQEPINEFVDDTALETANQEMGLEENSESNKPSRSHSTTPQNFLDNEDTMG